MQAYVKIVYQDRQTTDVLMIHCLGTVGNQFLKYTQLQVTIATVLMNYIMLPLTFTGAINTTIN